MPIINQVVQGGGGSAPAHYIEKTVKNGTLHNSSPFIDLTGVTDIFNYVLPYAYNGTQFAPNTNIDMSSITTLSGSESCKNMLSSTSGISNVDLSSLTTISGAATCQNMFMSSSVTSINLDSLTTISGSTACYGMFGACQYLTNIDFVSLTTISGANSTVGMFNGCSSLTSAKFNALNVITIQLSPSFNQMFTKCYKLESLEFGGLTASTFTSIQNQFQYLFDTNTGRDAPSGCTVHFPSNFDPSDPNHTFDASTLAGYPTFGGNASYIHVAFDLPATE